MFVDLCSTWIKLVRCILAFPYSFSIFILSVWRASLQIKYAWCWTKLELFISFLHRLRFLISSEPLSLIRSSKLLAVFVLIVSNILLKVSEWVRIFYYLTICLQSRSFFFYSPILALISLCIQKIFLFLALWDSILKGSKPFFINLWTILFRLLSNFMALFFFWATLRLGIDFQSWNSCITFPDFVRRSLFKKLTEILVIWRLLLNLLITFLKP